MDDDDGWLSPTDPPDFWRYLGAIPSWALHDTIWTPSWKDAHRPAPCLCSTWGGYGDESRILAGLI
jgi:hypothetical protein